MKLKKKPNGVFYIDLRVNGVGQRVGLDTKEPKDAAEQFRLWKMNIHPKQLGVSVDALGVAVSDKSAEKCAKPRGMTLEKALERCLDTVWATVKTQASMRSRVKQLSMAYGQTLITDIDAEWLEDMVTHYRRLGKAEGTIKRLLEAISKVIVMGNEWKNPDTGKPWLSGRPKFPHVNVKNFLDRVLSHEEERKVFAAIEKRREDEPGRQWWRFGKLVRFLLDTGMRLNEALGVGSASVSTLLVNGQAVMFVSLARYTTKNDKPRMVPLSEAIMDDLAVLTEQEVKGRFFPMNPALTWYMWDQIRGDVGTINDVKLHSLRHTCATRLIKGNPELGVPGLDIYRLKEWLGHSDISITAERYAHLDPSDLVAGLQVMNHPSNTGREQQRFAKIDNRTNRTTEEHSANRAKVGTH